MTKTPIIQSQHTPPPIREKYVEQRNLNKKLMRATKHPLTLIFAGAGYGKSTALSLFAQQSNKAVCWYSISQNDDDVVPFIEKIIFSISKEYPAFRHLSKQVLNRRPSYIKPDMIYSFATNFLTAIGELNEEIILVLDDFHYVANSNDIEKWLLFVLDHAPNHLHIILSSRRRPRWDSLPRLKIQGSVLEITQFDFILTPDEMQYMLHEMYQINLTDDEVKSIYRLTEGWAIAFNMLVKQMINGSSFTTILQNQKKSLKDLFDYLATEVLSKQSFIMQQFLMQSSIFDVLSPKVCDEVLEIRGSEEMFNGLMEQNLFIVEGDKSYFRYHALFKSFLENNLQKNFKEEYHRLHIRAARYFEQTEEIDKALYHYEKIKAHDSLAYLLNYHGLEILKSGRLKSLYDLLIKIPGIDKQQYPVLYYYQGEIERYHSKYDLALQHYENIIQTNTLAVKEDDYLSSLAFEGIARIYLDTIQPDKAARYVEQAIALREKSHAPKEDMAKLNVLMAENLLNAGKAKEAEIWYDRARKLNIPLEENNLQARIYLRTGRLQKARKVLERQKDNANVMGNHQHLPQSHRETDILLSLIDAFMGNAEESKTFASRGIQLGLEIQSPFVESCGWMRMGHAVQLLEHYETSLAVQCYETSLEIMEKINVSRGTAEPYMGLCLLYGRKLEYDRAMENADKGLVETEKVKDRWLSALIKLGKGITQVYNGYYKDAQEMMELLKLEFMDCGDRYGLMIAAFWSAYISNELKQEEQFRETMQLFLEEVQSGGYEFFLKRRTFYGPSDMQNIIPMLIKARQLDIEISFIHRLLQELGLEVTLKKHPGYTLTIHTLGQLNVWIGNKQLEQQDWQRGKAKELFALFITNRKKMLLREEIYQYLWPEQDEQTASKNFKVTLNALLKALEPNRKAREDSFFIVRNGSAYGLNQEVGYELDCIDFESLVIQGMEETDPKRAKNILFKGLHLYKDDYFIDFRFAHWSITERERLQQVYLRGAEKLAQCHVRLLDFHACLDWCEKILAKDNTWEEAYRLIMYCYYQINNRPQAIKWYEKCCETLEQEIGVEPMESTKEMYRIIIESEELNYY